MRISIYKLHGTIEANAKPNPWVNVEPPPPLTRGTPVVCLLSHYPGGNRWQMKRRYTSRRLLYDRWSSAVRVQTSAVCLHPAGPEVRKVTNGRGLEITDGSILFMYDVDDKT